VLLTVDNTLSMRDVGAARSACEALAVLVRAMTQLEIGQLAVSSWGESYKMLHGFGEPWGDDDACRVLEQLTFAQTEVKDADNLASMLASMDEARTRHSGADDLVQLCFVLSDGLIKSDNRNKIRALVRQAQEKRQVIVYVVLDPQEKITNMQRVSVIPGGGISRVRYLDVFPYSYYVLVHDIKSLGRVLGDALRQWLELYHDQE
jgi:midasin